MFQPLIDWFNNAIRSLFSLLDSVGYFLLSGVYNIFFTVANAKIFEGDVINEFFRRIQLILGIIMIFNLAITAINIIINPDLFKDKEKGAGKIVFRIALSLVMLSLVAPINFGTSGDGNDLNTQISNNGILFGFLYQFQDSVMKDNILGKLILGSTTETNEGNYGDLDNMSDVGIDLANTVARAFITPTLKDTSDDPGVDPHNITEDDVACSEVITDYEYASMDYKALIKYINDTCDSDSGEVYVFSYTPLVGFICAIIMIVIIIGFTLDVAVRSIKLVILRLIAPIPIISYMVPGQEKNGVFSNWVKTLSSTYLDLFIRLIVIYFGAYVIIIISNGNVDLWVNGPGFFTSLLATVFIIIGVLMFMKQAPKFFQDMLGLKGDGKLFSGIGTMLGAAALTGGLAGSVVSAAKTGYAEGQEMGHGKFKSTLRGVTSGAGGFLGGVFSGGAALLTADKRKASAVRAAMQKGIVRRASGSTLFGRGNEYINSMLTGSTTADRYDSQIAAYNNFADLFSSFDAQSDADSTWLDPTTGRSVKDLKERYDLLQASNASPADVERARDEWKNAKKAFQNAVINGKVDPNDNIAKQMQVDYANARRLVVSAGLKVGDMSDSGKFKTASHTAKNEARNLKNSTRYKASVANRNYNK